MSRKAIFALTCCANVFWATTGFNSPETALALTFGGGAALFGHWLVSHPRD